MITPNETDAPADSPENTSMSDVFPNSKRIYVKGTLHDDVQVPMREVSLAETNHPNGRIKVNEPVRIYDNSGPWGDPDFDGDVENGLPALRRQWILDRGDVEEYEGRQIKPEDNGYLSDEHADRYNSNKSAKNRLKEYPGLKRQPLRASEGHAVTQMWYAKQGIVTPEMEFIALRENMGREAAFRAEKRRERPAQSHEFPASGTIFRSSHPGAYHPRVCS